MTPDPTIRELREQIAQRDRAIVDAVNERIQLVAAIKRHKEENGLPFLDPRREEELLAELARVNEGPLSEDGLRELVAAVLALTKRELERTE